MTNKMAGAFDPKTATGLGLRQLAETTESHLYDAIADRPANMSEDEAWEVLARLIRLENETVSKHDILKAY